MQEQMRALSRARCRGLQERNQLLAPNELWCFGLCHGCTLFDLAAAASTLDPEQSHGPSPRLGLPCRPLVARATRARRINCCPGALRLSRHLGVLNAGRADRLQQAAPSSGGVLTASSAKDYADVAFQRSAFACAHANSLTTQKQHAGDDRTGGSREKLR
jgi:hypothetical protein